MKLSRQGHYKNKGQTLLLDRPIEGSGSESQWESPRWEEEMGELYVRLKGVEDDATYDYALSIPSNDLVALVETALRGRANTAGEYAMAASTVAFIREFLSPAKSNANDQMKHV